MITISGIIGALAIYVVTTIIYNVFFHPLATVPGPFFAKLTSWPSFYHSLKGDRHIWQWQCFQLYGDRFRATPNTVLFRKPEAYNDIYNQKANVKKSNYYDAWPRNLRDVNTLSATDPALHAKKRKLISIAFTDQSIKGAAVLIQGHITRWTELLFENGGTKTESTWSEPRDMSKWADNLTFDIAGDLAFGVQFQTKEPKTGDSRFKEIPSSIIQLMTFLYPVTKSPFLSLVIWLKPRGLSSFLEAMAPPQVRGYYDFLEGVVQKRLQEGSGEKGLRKDLFSLLASATDPATGKRAYDSHDLLAESHLLVIAGTHTTGAALSAMYFYLCHFPRVYDKLAKEIRGTFSSEEEIKQGTTLLSCTYLRACIEETLRIAPPGPSELPRVVLKGGAVIDGEHYPEGTIVGNSGWSNGHNEEVYGDSEIYRPERWIPCEETGVTEADVAQLKRGFTAFSKGPDSCLGRDLALLELSLAVAKPLYSMDVRLVPGNRVGEGEASREWGQWNRNVYQLGDLYMAIRDGPIVQFRKRAG
ncbi:benzoate 4-monooxygenase cytochrome P450 [Polyplosphaeria fusca]|uniref:Benzoate 4-monooxygenase cytochrome P450 n=1 Tax=Polyplosphaeria fusca TaxID=682080 RepID=A0A9P4UY34_9PLEO|nr:benzoate 4-monooxygenase cytochrome P450 [Polyplosphaeria fusca]